MSNGSTAQTHQTAAPESQDERSSQVRSVLKALALLESLAGAAQAGLTLSELSRRHELHPSTTHRLLHTLMDVGYVRQNAETRRYLAGSGLVRLAGRPLPTDDRLLTTAVPLMQRLSEQVGECVSLTILHHDEVELIAQSGSDAAEPAAVGSRLPAYCTAGGKALLAALDTESLALRLPHLQLQPRTPNTIIDAEELALELDRVRRRGYAVNDEELDLGVRCVAAVIRNARGAGVAALAISGPTARVNVHHFADLAQSVQRCALQISRQSSTVVSTGEK